MYSENWVPDCMSTASGIFLRVRIRKNNTKKKKKKSLWTLVWNGQKNVENLGQVFENEIEINGTIRVWFWLEVGAKMEILKQGVE